MVRYCVYNASHMKILCALAFLALSTSSLAGWDMDPERINESFEGAYEVTYDCEAQGNCPPETSSLTRLVILGTGKPSLLGNGLGLVVTLAHPTTGDVFKFYGASFDLQSCAITAESTGNSGQAATLELVLDHSTMGFTGVLRNTLSPDDLTFSARPLKTAAMLYGAQADEPIAAGEVNGHYVGKVGSNAGKIMIKKLGQSNFAGTWLYMPDKLEMPLHTGILDEKKGRLTFLHSYHGHQVKIFLKREGVRWRGFTLSSYVGTFNSMELERKSGL